MSLGYQDSMTSSLGKGIYFVVSILALSSLNLGRTIAFSLITELPSPHWRNYFLVCGSELSGHRRRADFGWLHRGQAHHRERAYRGLRRRNCLGGRSIRKGAT
ncbi:unnamed protein product [Prorocentrum cordatum]|uniref:Uncharacterized protein n=1 Tax=Prorocentrum cordatum TaxID=2364126 RepID=A0ABN9QTL4_9DINO|nr:unnamed protein product [Polarella glacialis]